MRFIASIKVAALTFVTFLLVMPLGFANAIDIKDVKSSKGIHAWLVQDESVPIVAIQFSFAGGNAQDPNGKEGLAALMSGLFDEGAGNIRSEAFQARLDDLGAEMSFRDSRDRIMGSMRVLAKNRDAAFNLLALAVQKPRFDQDAIDRIRSQIITGLKAEEKDPSTIARDRLNALVYGKHPYGRRANGTVDSQEKITRDDLVKAHRAMMVREGLHIGIVGPISEKEAGEILDKVFGPLPEKGKLTVIKDAKLNLGGMANVPYDLPQTQMTLVYPGLYRSDPDFFAAYLMNHILGGSGLTSRLFEEVREKRGLAYSVGSNLSIYDHAAAFVIYTGTQAEKAENSLKTIREEVKKMVSDGVSQEELDDAKSYVIGAYAVQNMGSSTQIASTLVALQDQNLPIDYINKRADEINAVSRKDIKAVAKKLLSGEPALLVVGPAKN